MKEKGRNGTDERKHSKINLWLLSIYYEQNQQIKSNTHVGLCNTVKKLKTTQYTKL